MKFLFLILILALSITNVNAAKKKNKPYYGITKQDYNCESVERIRNIQGPDFASKFYFDKREANRIVRCLNKRKEKKEIYYIDGR